MAYLGYYGLLYNNIISRESVVGTDEPVGGVLGDLSLSGAKTKYQEISQLLKLKVK